MIRSFRAFVPPGALRLLIAETFLIAGSLLLATYLFVYPDPIFFLLVENGLARLGLVLGTLVLFMQLRGLYSPQVRRLPYLFLVQELCLALGFTFIVQAAVSYLSTELRAPIWIVVAGGAIAIVAITVWRLVYGTVVWKTAERRVLFVGDGPLLDEAAAFLEQHPYIGLRAVGFVGEPDPDRDRPAGKCLGSFSNLDPVVRAARPDLIVVGLDENRRPLPAATLFELRTAGFQVEKDFAFIEQACGYFPTGQLRPGGLIFSSELAMRATRLAEAVDSALAALAVLLALPVMLGAALAVKLSSRGPVFDRQPRVGRRGEVFPLYRFRVTDGDGMTAAGRALRAWNVEQWPQLFNVLRGEMALVGPRPERPEFVRILVERIPFYKQRHVVKPGLTGWAQIQYNTTPENTLERLQYDLYYIKYKSHMLDNYVILRCARALLQRGLG